MFENLQRQFALTARERQRKDFWADNWKYLLNIKIYEKNVLIVDDNFGYRINHWWWNSWNDRAHNLHGKLRKAILTEIYMTGPNHSSKKL